MAGFYLLGYQLIKRSVGAFSVNNFITSPNIAFNKLIPLSCINCLSHRVFSSNSNMNSNETEPCYVEKEINISDSSKEISTLLQTLEKLIYSALNLHENQKLDVIKLRKYALHNFKTEDLKDISISNLIYKIEQNFSTTNLLPIAELPHILELLTMSCIPPVHSYFVKSYEAVCDNLSAFGVHEMSILAQYASIQNDVMISTKIVQHFKVLLENNSLSEELYRCSDSDLSILFRFLGNLMSIEMLELCVLTACERINQRGFINFSSIRPLCELAEGSCGEATDIVRERIVQSGILSLDTDFNIEELDLESAVVIGNHLDTVFKSMSIASKIRKCCFKSRSSRPLDILSTNCKEAVKLAFLLPSTYTRNVNSTVDNQSQQFNQDFTSHLINCEIFSDNHQLFQVLYLVSCYLK